MLTKFYSSSFLLFIFGESSNFYYWKLNRKFEYENATISFQFRFSFMIRGSIFEGDANWMKRRLVVVRHAFEKMVANKRNTNQNLLFVRVWQKRVYGKNITGIGQKCNKVKDNANKDINNDKELVSFEGSNRLEHLTACHSIQSNLKLFHVMKLRARNF